MCVGVGDDAGGETNELAPSHAMAIFRLKKRRDGSKHYSVVGRVLSLISVHSTESMYLMLFRTNCHYMHRCRSYISYP